MGMPLGDTKDQMVATCVLDTPACCHPQGKGKEL